MKNTHLHRWITSLVILPFLIFILAWGKPLPVSLVALAVAMTALWEYYRIIFPGRTFRDLFPVSATAFLAAPFLIWAGYRADTGLIIAIFVLNFILAGMASLFRFTSTGELQANLKEEIAREVAGVTHIPLMLSLLLVIYQQNQGVAWTFLILSVVFISDTGAFYAGTYLGKRKLWPAVSPGKTVAGALGGIFAGVSAGVFVKALFLPETAWLGSLVMFIVMAAAGQLGDLYESMLKRAGGVKDSGAILPGHGGILDRIDALLFAVPVAWLFIMYLL